jgi:penicillin-binding protein 1A
MIVSIRTSQGKELYRNKFLKSEDKVLDGMTSPFLNAILQKAINEGTGRSMKSLYGVNLPLAGKTGTSQDYADAWFMAYNPKLVIATRVGAAYPSIHFSSGDNGSGSRFALPLVAKTLQKVQNNPNLRRSLFEQFDKLPIEYQDALACEDYLEDSDFERFFEGIFQNENITYDKQTKKTERTEKKKKKKSCFKRIFGKKGG